MMRGATLAILIALSGASTISAETIVLAASLTSGAPLSPPGVVIFPFVGDSEFSGWATITVDASSRTVSYRVTVVNAPSALAGSLHLAPSGTTGPALLNFVRPMSTSIVLNNFGDDVCYSVDAVSFEGTVRAADFVVPSDQVIGSADDIFAAILDGQSYVTVASVTNPGTAITGRVVRKADGVR